MGIDKLIKDKAKIIKDQVKIVERNINQLSGFLQGHKDKRVRDIALRMLDEIEIILKKMIK